MIISRFSLIIALCIGMGSFSFAQQQSNGNEIKAHTFTCKDLKNTYQIIVRNQRNYSLPSNLCEIIVEKRHETEEVIHKFGPYVSVKILPKSTITAGKLEQLPEVKFETY